MADVPFSFLRILISVFSSEIQNRFHGDSRATLTTYHLFSILIIIMFSITIVQQCGSNENSWNLPNVCTLAII